MTVIAAIAADLHRITGSKEIIPGHVTRSVLEVAYTEYRGLIDKGELAKIAVMASRAGPEWDNVVMSDVMFRYLLNRGVPRDHLISQQAPYFHTNGELCALGIILGKQEMRTEVIIIARSWHMLRIKYLWEIRMLLSDDLGWFETRYVKVPTKFSKHALLEPIAIVQNFFRWWIKGC